MTKYFDSRNMPELVEGTHIEGWLDLRGSKLKSLPNNLTVDYSLILNNSSIKELPENLTVGYEINMNDTAITNIPESLNFGENKEGIKGFILVNDLSKITFPDKFKKKIADRKMMKEELYGKVVDKKNAKEAKGMFGENGD